MDRAELARAIKEETLFSNEVIEVLGITKQNLSSLVKRGKLVPVKESGTSRLFLRSDVMQRKQEAELLNEKYRPYD